MLTFDETARLVQKYLERKPVIILGSGASVPYGLPTMHDLSKEIHLRINCKYEGNSHWNDFSLNLKTYNDLEKALQEVQLPHYINDDIISTTWEYINELDLKTFEILIKNFSDFGLAKLFKKILYTHPMHISIVTTNYDRLAEYAADLAYATAFTGFNGNIIKHFESRTIQPIMRNRCVDIWKVHGSLDWFKDPMQQLISIPLSKKIPENYKPLIVTPGIQKYQETHNEPYRTVIAKADECISNAFCYLCIGYGFNDEHIQPKLIYEIRQKNKPIIVITKKISENGKAILTNSQNNKYMIFEELYPNKTKVLYANEEMELEGDYWKLDSFIKIWFAD